MSIRARARTFDTWTATATRRVEMAPVDIAAANAYLRRLDLALRTPDALNMAMARRLRADLYTFDVKMAHAARATGATVVADRRRARASIDPVRRLA